MLLEEIFPKTKRKYYQEGLNLTQWRTVKREFFQLLNKPIECVEDLERLILQSGEGLQILLDHRNELFIRLKMKTSIFNFFRYLLFQKKILSKGLKYHNQWENKIANSPFKAHLDENRYGHFLKILLHQKKMYTPTNNSLITQEELLSNRYFLITSRMKALFNNTPLTLPDLERGCFNPVREVRKQSFDTLMQSYLHKETDLQTLFQKLLNIRHTIALNAGLQNYRDYSHQIKARFSYGIADILVFHKVIQEEVVPVLQLVNQKFADSLQINQLTPWDTKAELLPAPFRDPEDCMNKCHATLRSIKEEYGILFDKMVKAHLVDIFHRKKKSPGSYNVPFFERGASYIFANFSTLRPSYQDISILHHEFGHALHHHFIHRLDLMAYKNLPAEVAELAAMTMELLTLEHLSPYYSNPLDQATAKEQQLRRLLQLIVSRTQGDVYQHWVYMHPTASHKERNEAYIDSMNRFSDGVSWESVKHYQHLESLKNHHFFQTPFYYIEYAFSALGALDIYRKYKENKQAALSSYETFLKKGYSQDVHLLYEEAGSSFNFSKDRIHDLMQFVRFELSLSC